MRPIPLVCPLASIALALGCATPAPSEAPDAAAAVPEVPADAVETPDASPPVPDAPAPSAPEGRAALEVFVPPFAGARRATNPFDHAPSRRPMPGAVLDFRGQVVLGTAGHRAWDIELPVGTEVVAMADGVVQRAGPIPPFHCAPLGREVSGQIAITVQHVLPNGMVVETAYDHLSRVDVAAGDVVLAGAPLGASGNTGCSLAPHLHLSVFQIVEGQQHPIDPFGWEGEAADPWASARGGLPSRWLWKEAPALWFEKRRPADASDGTEHVGIGAVRWRGVRDGPEAIELQVDPRVGPDVAEVGGWTLQAPGGQRFVVPDGARVRAGRPLVVAIGDGGTGDVRWPTAAPLLPDGGGTVRLFSPDGVEAHAFDYGLALTPEAVEAPPEPSCPDAALGCIPLPVDGEAVHPAWAPDGRGLAVAVGAPRVAVVFGDVVGRPRAMVVDRYAGGQGRPEDVANLRWLSSGLLVFDAPQWDGRRTVWYAAPGFAAAEALPPQFGDEVTVADAAEQLLVVSRGVHGRRNLHAVQVGDPEPRALTQHGVPEEDVVISPDGTQAMFRRGGRIYRLDLATGETTGIATPFGDVAITAWLGEQPLLLDRGVVYRVGPSQRDAWLEHVEPGRLAADPSGRAVVVLGVDGVLRVVAADGTEWATGRPAGDGVADLALTEAPDGWRVAYTAHFTDGPTRGLGVVVLTP